MSCLSACLDLFMKEKKVTKLEQEGLNHRLRDCLLKDKPSLKELIQANRLVRS